MELLATLGSLLLFFILLLTVLMVVFIVSGIAFWISASIIRALFPPLFGFVEKLLLRKEKK